MDFRDGDLREGMENIFFPRRDAKGREERPLACCLNQDLRDFDGFSGWNDLREGMENIVCFCEGTRRGAKNVSFVV